MKKYHDFYFTVRHEETVSRNSHTPLKMFAWFIRNKDGSILQSSIGDSEDYNIDWGDRNGLYYDKIEAELDAKEAIDDHYR